ncbi:MAG: membrane protein [Minwuia thermotolerans]|nr:MAG: membrane protein [Minwuia thermotolerans]
MQQAVPEFDFRLRPYRSLGPRGFLIVMSLIAGISFITGLLFMLKGAWPVFGFLGLDVALIWFAFRQNYRAARAEERLFIQGSDLVVSRHHANGRQQIWRFPAYWARFDLTPHHSGDNVLSVASHGNHLAIGGFLSAEERVELADELTVAIRDWRTRRPA